MSNLHLVFYKNSFLTQKIIKFASNRFTMKLPKFLMADNTDFPDDIFVVHTEYPRFVLNVEEEEVEWFDEFEGDNEDEISDEITKVIEQAYDFCDAELAKYDDELEEEEEE